MMQLLLDEDLHDGSADLHPHTILLEHVEKRQETLLGKSFYYIKYKLWKR